MESLFIWHLASTASDFTDATKYGDGRSWYFRLFGHSLFISVFTGLTVVPLRWHGPELEPEVVSERRRIAGHRNVIPTPLR